MSREQFIQFACIAFLGWRLHPGYKAPISSVDVERAVALAEELWQLMQH